MGMALLGLVAPSLEKDRFTNRIASIATNPKIGRGVHE
jgi:hypothetical protein